MMLLRSSLLEFERIAVRVDEVETSITLVRDPKDEPYLNLAAHVEADFLVSRDPDLLESTHTIAQDVVRCADCRSGRVLGRGPSANWRRFLN
jgi:predicted nucleic acid-binding protein